MGVGICLEKQLQNLTDRKFVLPMRSGTAAIISALIASRIPENSEVILPSICCPAVFFAVSNAGFCPIIADVSKENFCMGENDILNAATKDTKAIIAVHSYGRYCKIQNIQELASKNNWFLIEDACLALGGKFKGKALGSFGDVSIFSFGYDKIIDVGGGGAILTDNSDLHEKCKRFLDNNKFFVYKNSAKKDTELKRKFSNLQDSVMQRNSNASIYDSLLNIEKVFKPLYNADIVYWRYSALYKGDRAKLVGRAKKEGIIITTHYKGLHQLRTGDILNNADLISNQVINLFVKPESVTLELIQKTAEFINRL